MSALLNELSLRAEELPEEERVVLAEQLLGSFFAAPSADVDLAWDREIHDRIMSLERGDGRTVSAADVFAKARRIAP